MRLPCRNTGFRRSRIAAIFRAARPRRRWEDELDGVLERLRGVVDEGVHRAGTDVDREGPLVAHAWMLAHARHADCSSCEWRCDVEDRVKGEMKKAEGKVKEEFGKVAGDRSTEWGGKVDQLKGEVQKKSGEIEQEAEREEQADEAASSNPPLHR